jgi:hypothetical protein
MTQGPGTKASDPVAAPAPKLAEPPIPGGRVEALMGVLIRTLKSSPLARPLPAVSLSVLGLGLLAFTGLCATAPRASGATLPVLLPLTALARRLDAPVLSADVTNAIVYPAITLCCLGLAGMLWANSRGWRPDPRRVSRRGATVWHDLATGVLIGIALGIKINAAFVALGIAVPLIRERAWVRLLRTAATTAVVTFGLYFFTYGLNALRPLPQASGRVISPSFWRLFQIIGGPGRETTPPAPGRATRPATDSGPLRNTYASTAPASIQAMPRHYLNGGRQKYLCWSALNSATCTAISRSFLPMLSPGRRVASRGASSILRREVTWLCCTVRLTHS